MFDGVHAGAERRRDAVRADGVSGDFLPQTMRFFDDGLGFVVGEIHAAMQNAVSFEMVAAV